MKEDVQNAIASTKATAPTTSAPQKSAVPTLTGERVEKRVPMTRLRATIAKRLLDAQHNAAMLTTFNEVNMGPLMDLRKRYKDLMKHTMAHVFGFMGFLHQGSDRSPEAFPGCERIN